MSSPATPNVRVVPRAVRSLVVAFAALFIAASFVAITEDVAMARPGGGSSFSGSRSRSSGSRSSSRSSGGSRAGSSSSSSRSSGSASSFGEWVIDLIVQMSIFGILVWVIVSKRGAAAAWSTGGVSMRRTSPRRELLALQRTDPNFSLVLFDDFLVALYTEVRMAHGKGQLARYLPYLSPAAASGLGHPQGEVTNVIVGVASIEEVRGQDLSSSHVWVKVSYETNYSVRGPQGEYGVYSHEEWTLARRRDARSRTPDKAWMIGCPSCGAPLDVVVSGTCGHCRSNVVGGSFDWAAQSIVVRSLERRGPMLTSDVAEQGTNLPTVIDPLAQQRFTALQAADPGTSWPSLSARIGLTFNEFQIAWASRDLARMRPLMSDALFSTQRFWIEEYKRQGLRNITENAQIAHLELANVTQDAFYDAVTVRLYASSLDYTVSDATNQIVSGNRSQPRRYTEYWTMIRGRGAKGPPRMEKVCPHCGGPLNVSMVGNCTYCNVKVTSGKFDWVLSRIEQDEVYRG